MKAKLVIPSCVLLMGLIAGVAQAVDNAGGVIEPWLDKWFQPPEMVELWGYDIASNWDPYDDNPMVVVMDDWMCNETGWVKGFRWWGSYFADGSIGDLTGFWLSIHNDHPAGAEPSHPGTRLVEDFVPIADIAYEHPIGVDASGKMVYEYFAWLDECFWQEQGTVYWLNIVAEIWSDETDDLDYDIWGWHTATLGPAPDYEHNIDDAVEIADYVMDTGLYQEFNPIEWEGYSLDMAFEVIPEPGTLLLALPGLIGLAAVIRRRK